MEDDGELEKRAVAELLNETNRARVRAETMGPAGWMKCPLRSTNKRFLLNTLRSTTPQHRTSGHSGSNRSRSRTPPREHRDNVHCRDSPERSHRDGRQDYNNGHRHRNQKRERGRDGDRHRNKKCQDRRASGHERDKASPKHTRTHRKTSPLKTAFSSHINSPLDHTQA
ncbi:hypothetical protein DPEC_G00078120 [Dallia pectoralis]|uniref:Uncharacterized protein n=1 Tax=Dallia pectoralis TaxID=75939 RepID=A0ACC2H4N7_DALPE|nr:hypothetical protein DPEC_G00078120 [Dallia pectoralis]